MLGFQFLLGGPLLVITQLLPRRLVVWVVVGVGVGGMPLCSHQILLVTRIIIIISSSTSQCGRDKSR